MHDWSDQGVDWQGISDAAQFIEDYCAKWGRFGGQSKEKWGEVRFYAQMGHLSLHSLIFPKCIYFKHPKFPDWLWKFDIDVLFKFFRIIDKPFTYWQVLVYSRAYHLAMKKWPHLRAEILNGADHPNLIEGVTRQYKDDKDEWHLEILGWNGEKIGGWISSSRWEKIR